MDPQWIRGGIARFFAARRSAAVNCGRVFARAVDGENGVLGWDIRNPALLAGSSAETDSTTVASLVIAHGYQLPCFAKRFNNRRRSVTSE